MSKLSADIVDMTQEGTQYDTLTTNHALKKKTRKGKDQNLPIRFSSRVISKAIDVNQSNEETNVAEFEPPPKKQKKSEPRKKRTSKKLPSPVNQSRTTTLPNPSYPQPKQHTNAQRIPPNVIPEEICTKQSNSKCNDSIDRTIQVLATQNESLQKDLKMAYEERVNMVEKSKDEFFAMQDLFWKRLDEAAKDAKSEREQMRNDEKKERKKEKKERSKDRKERIEIVDHVQINFGKLIDNIGKK